jgi:hypothetical protein
VGWKVGAEFSERPSHVVFVARAADFVCFATDTLCVEFVGFIDFGLVFVLVFGNFFRRFPVALTLDALFVGIDIVPDGDSIELKEWNDLTCVELL